MGGRERVRAAVSHQQPDRVPVDLGSTAVTGIAASTLHGVRVALGLSQPDEPVNVVEPYQMLGEVTDDLREALGIDTVGVGRRANLFGFENKNWKEWRLFDGTPVLVPEAFNTEPEPNGDILMYPQGDRTAPPSGRMPAGGYYFDTIVRQDPIEESALDPRDNLEEFAPIPEDEIEEMRLGAARLRAESDRAIVASFGGTSFGDIALVPAPFLKYPRGIRDVEEWYVSTVVRREYVRKVFEGQCEIALANLARLARAMADLVDVVFVTGTDFGTQRGLFASRECYRDLFMPVHRRVNAWIHDNTPWLTLIHSCGAVEPLIGDFIEAGFDILNPVQCSASGMDPVYLKERYGDRITFWGAVVDTQRTLPFGTPADVRREVRERVAVLGRDGGFVANAIHNIQPRTPPENVIAMFEELALGALA